MRAASAVALAAWLSAVPAQGLSALDPDPRKKYLPLLFIDETLFESTHGGMSLRVQPPTVGPSQPQPATSSWQRALLNPIHYRVNPGSLYRCGRSTLRAACGPCRRKRGA